jgi:hypothetical protein
MAKVILNKETLSKSQYQKVIDTSFSQLVQPTPVTPQEIPSISLAEFFNNYQEIFFQIPKFGDINSHSYLIKTSQEYVGSSQTTDDTIQALIEEVTQLRQENLILQQQLLSGSI